MRQTDSSGSWQDRSALNLGESAVEWLIRLCGWSSIIFVFAIFLFVFREAAPVLLGGDEPSPAEIGQAAEEGEEVLEVPPHPGIGEMLTSQHWRPTSINRAQYGILALVAGTLAVTVLAMLLAVPLGLGAAVYVSEFSHGKAKETLKIIIEFLAAIPSVVWGFVGLMVIAPIIIRSTGAVQGINVLNGGIILALMSVPIIVSVGEDALKAVPDSYREAALSLGASRWEVVYRVLFPAAKNGLLAAVLLGVGRAVGETMAVLMATGNAAGFPRSWLDPVQTLTATIAVELGEVVQGEPHWSALFAIGVVLFLITFAVNLAADLVVKGIRSEQQS